MNLFLLFLKLTVIALYTKNLCIGLYTFTLNLKMFGTLTVILTYNKEINLLISEEIIVIYI